MAMSSGKSSSMAAVLLVVAVAMAAGTCASGAQAKFDIYNDCKEPVVFTTANGNSKLTRGSTLHVHVPLNLFFTAQNVTYTIRSKPPVTVTMGQSALDELKKLDDNGQSLKTIIMDCEKNCITLFVVYQPRDTPTYITSLGPFCR